MKKNRFLALALSLLMALALPLGAFAEENEPDTLLEGLVTEVLEQGFVMEDIELGSVLLNVDETTRSGRHSGRGRGRPVRVRGMTAASRAAPAGACRPRGLLPAAAQWTCPWACCSPATRPSAM